MLDNHTNIHNIQVGDRLGEDVVCQVTRDYLRFNPQSVTFEWSYVNERVNSKKSWTLHRTVEAEPIEPVFEVGDAIYDVDFPRYPDYIISSIDLIADKVFYESGAWDVYSTMYKNGYRIRTKATKTNMNIEIGDTVEIVDRCGSPYEVGSHQVVTAVDGEYYHIGIMIFNKNRGSIKLVSKAGKKIVGYKLLQDTPDTNKGAVLTFKGGFWATPSNNPDVITEYVDEFVVGNTKWFEPIYKAAEQTIKFSKYSAVLSKTDGLKFSDGESLSFTEVQKLVKLMADTNVRTKARAFDVVVVNEVKSVSVGCKTFNKKDIELITKAVIELQ